MTQINRSNKKYNQTPGWAGFTRMAVGIILVWKAINFVNDTAVLKFLRSPEVEGMLTGTDAILILSVSVVTMLAGVFIATGLFTRIAAFIELPVFLFGTIFIHGGYVERNGFELILTMAIPFFLLSLVMYGNRMLPGDLNRRENDRGRVVI